MTKIIAISDTHAQHSKVIVPEGDILIHAGDWSFDTYNKPNSVAFIEFLQWFESQPHKHKVLVAGNHDQLLEKNPDIAMYMMEYHAPNVTYLQDSEVTMEGLTIWGSPMTPTFYNWSFNRKSGPEIAKHWKKIPKNIDVLVTHGPALGILDKSRSSAIRRCGCKDLYDALLVTKPLVHIFGHIHGGYGQMTLQHEDGAKTDCRNVAICNEHYVPTRPATVIEL